MASHWDLHCLSLKISVPNQPNSSSSSIHLPTSIVDLFRQTFSTIDLTAQTSPAPHSSSHILQYNGQLDTVSTQQSGKLLKVNQQLLNGYGCCSSMSTKSNRKLPDARFTFSPPPLSHLMDRRDKYGARYGSAGDVSTGARGFSRLTRINWNRNNPVSPSKQEDMDSHNEGHSDSYQDSQQQNVPTNSESAEQAMETDVAAGGVQQRNYGVMVSHTTDRTNVENEVPECFSNTRKFSRVISPTEMKGKKKRKQSIGTGNEVSTTPKCPRRERPTAADEQEEDFFEKLFLDSLEFMSDEAEECEGDSDDYHDNAVFKELYQRNKQIIQNENKAGHTNKKVYYSRPKSYDDDFQTDSDINYIGEAHGVATAGASIDSKQGILQRHPSPGKRHVNVHFNNDVSVETFSHSDQKTGTLKSLLAHGDGPPRLNNILGTSVPVPPPVPHFTVASGSGPTGSQTLKLQAFQKLESAQKLEMLGKDNSIGPLDYVKGKILKKLSNGSKTSSSAKRKDSMPKVVSPTDLLRQKQKTVTDKIIKETLYQKTAIPASPGQSGVLLSKQMGRYNPQQGNVIADLLSPKGSGVHNHRHIQEMKECRTVENQKLAASDISTRNGTVESSSSEREKYDRPSHEKTQFDEGLQKSHWGCRQGLTPTNDDSKDLPYSHEYFPNRTVQSKRNSVSDGKTYHENGQESLADTDKDSVFERDEDSEKYDRSPGLGAFSYTTPSKLFQKVGDRENAEKGSPGLGSFSYTTPSELFMKRESLAKTSSKEQPGYWFFKRESDTRQPGDNAIASKSGSDSISLHESNTNVDGCMDSTIEISQKEADERNFKRKKKFMDRCKRKKRLDSMEQWTEENLSCLDTVRNILSETNSLEANSDASIITDTNCPETSIKCIRQSFDKITSSTEMGDSINMMEELLSDFLNMMERKLNQGLPITTDILRELEFIYDSLFYIARNLKDQLEEGRIQGNLSADSDEQLNPLKHAQTSDLLGSWSTKNYAVWMTLMLESSANFLYGSSSKEHIRNDTRRLKLSFGKRGTESRYLADDNGQNKLQTVLCDLGVIRDSLTCLLTDDQIDFSSITDLSTIYIQNENRQQYGLKCIPGQGSDDKSSKTQVEVTEGGVKDHSATMDIATRQRPMPVERKPSVKERLERKQHLDGMEQRSQMFSSVFNRMESILDSMAVNKNLIAHEHMPKEYSSSFNSARSSFQSVSETGSYLSDTMDPFIVIYEYLCDFLQLIEEKQELGLALTSDDCWELELIYDTLMLIAGKLINESGHSEKTASDDEFENKSQKKSNQSQQFANWLINKLGRTASLLVKQSSYHVPPSSQVTQGASGYGQSHVESQISLQDILIDLKSVHDSMASLLHGQKLDFSDITNFSLEDDRKNSNVDHRGRPEEVSNYSLVSGYLADTDSQESLGGKMQPKDSLLLTKYQQVKTGSKYHRESEFFGTGDSVQFVAVQASDAPERQQRHSSIANIHNIQMPQREWSPRDHRHFTSTDTGSRNEGSNNVSEHSQSKTSTKIYSNEWFYSPSGHLLFGDANIPSSSTSLNDKLSISTWGTLHDSDFAQLEEQKTTGELNNGMPQDSIYKDWSPRFWTQETYRGIDPDHLQPPSQSLPPKGTRFISPDQHVNKEVGQNIQEEIYSNKFREVEESFTDHSNTTADTVARKSNNIPTRESNVIQQNIQSSKTDPSETRDRVNRMSDWDLVDILPNKYIPQEMFRVQVRDRLMNMPIIESAGMTAPDKHTKENIQMASRDRVQSELARNSVESTTDEEIFPRETIGMQIRDKMNNITDTALSSVDTDVCRDSIPRYNAPKRASMDMSSDDYQYAMQRNIQADRSNVRHRSHSLPGAFASRQKPAAIYELYKKEPTIPDDLPVKDTAGLVEMNYPRQKSSITFTSNPVYYEFDSYGEEGERTADQPDEQSIESQESNSMHLSDPTTRSDVSSFTQESPKEIRWSAQFKFPEDTGTVRVDLGPSKFTVNKMGLQKTSEEQEAVSTEILEGDSPERGQRLFGSTQHLDRRGEAAVSKRKPAPPTGRSMTPDTRSFLMEREVSDSQNRKLQMEVNTLQTENRLLKEKYNRATAKISELETQLQNTQEDLDSLQETLNKEMSELSARTKSEIDRDRDQMERKIVALSKENSLLKTEVSSLEKQLGSSHRESDLGRNTAEKNKTLEAHRAEIASLKEELNCVKALLNQSERHLREEEERHGEVSQQMLQLTELKNALQQQADTGGSGMVSDKQLKSLEKRLKVTEERLHQERSDRANNLSSVEDKLLTENARLQAVEKEFTRQLHREKDRNKNLEQRLKQVREENEKLRLAMPFDDSVFLSNKDSYDIPYSSHSNQRAETLKITDDMNYILSQIEKQDGVQSGQEEEMIRMLWNKRELAYKQLREWELQLKELRLEDNNIVDGLKNLRDTYGQAESKLKQMEEQVEDTRAQMNTLESTYKEQLSQLVRERHEAFARLKTAEDILEAVRTENNMLLQSLSGHQITMDTRHVSDHSEALQQEITSLTSKVTQLTRQNKLLDGELSTVRVQLDARTKALEDVQGELEQAHIQLKGDGSEERNREKIEVLTAQLNSLQVDLDNSTDKYNSLLTEKISLDVELANMKKTSEQQKTRQPRTETIESTALQELKDSLGEKDGRVTSLTLQLEEVENQLQRTRQDLYIEQEHSSELESEVETLQQTVSQRAQMFEALSGTEREQHAQYQLLKETLDSVTQELSHKHAQIISLDVNLSGQKDRVAELERELQEVKLQRTEDGEPDREEVKSGDRLRIHELEIERASLKQELSKAYSAIQASEEQFRTLQTESKQLEQEVVKEKTVVLQITAEKGEIEQHLEELAEEHDALIQEKNQAEEDLIKLENKLQEILQKYEAEARKQHGDFETQYSVLTPEARQMSSELDTLRLLLDGKEKEMGMLQDKLSRQLIEIDFLNRKVELVHNDSIANREDVARMISELTLKMKEAVSTREVNQFLVGERTKLQTEKNHIEKELEQERQNSDKRKAEVNEVIRKVETSELQQMSIKKEDKNKSVAIASLEAELRNATQNLTTTQAENSQLKSRLDHLQEDIKNLTAINATMEKRIEMEQNSLSEEKHTASKWKEDYNATVHDLELLRHEHVVLGNKLTAEEHSVENLKKQVQTRDEEINSLQEELRNLQLELDSSKGQLLLTKDSVHKLTQDKGSIYQDYEGMCRSLTEKERQLNEVRDRSEEKLDFLQREHTAERVRLEQDKTTAEKERDIVKQEMDSLNEQLKQKEVQLSTFGKTLSDLEVVTRKKNELEGHLRQVEGAAGDSKLLLEGQRKEVMALNEAIAKQQDEVTRLQVTNQTLAMDLKSEQATSTREIHDLKLTLEELKTQHENERHYLNDNLSQTQTQLRSVQESLASAAEARDSLQAQKRLADHTLEELQSKLSDESTARRLIEQSLGSLRLELEDLRNEKTISEARLAETKNQLSKCERQLKSEQDKSNKLSGRNQELVALTHSSDANVKAKDEQVDLLHKEITKLRQMLDSQKQSLTAKMKKATLEFKQQLDLVQEDKNKLSGQVQKLSTDLDLCREQIANKNKENLKLKEQVVSLEDNVRESQVKLKQAEDSLKMESENQSQMTYRYHEQDEELKRLRSFLAKKVEESGEADKSMWHEMNRVIQELSRQMQTHLDAKSNGNKTSDTHTIQRYKKQLAEVQGELSTEKSLHQITKTSLQALEEDCNRLRQQLQKLRRREKSPSSDRKYKNRMEAINAIIARSQSQAQALLASGGYIEDINYNNPHRSMVSPHRGYHSPNRPDSPDNSYASDLSIASLPPMPFSQYTTTTRAAESK